MSSCRGFVGDEAKMRSRIRMTESDASADALGKVLSSQWILWETLAPHWGPAGEHTTVLHSIVEVVRQRCRTELQYQTHSGDVAAWLATLSDEIAGHGFPTTAAEEACGQAVAQL